MIREKCYSLEDLNTSSDYYGENVGTSTFENQVTLHYFGHYNWGLCTTRFGELNEYMEDWSTADYPVQLIGVGKSGCPIPKLIISFPSELNLLAFSNMANADSVSRLIILLETVIILI